jgi:NitT/TauT family transport system ATP-binding protein
VSADCDCDYDIVLECKGLSHWFDNTRVLYDVNLQIVRGETVSLVGPSGCGKSTMLRAILGTHPPRDGQVLMNGEPVTQPGRDRGIVYQRYALFPYMTAVQNVAFGLLLEHNTVWQRLFRQWRCRQLYKQHLKEAAELLDRFKLGNALHLYPTQMSGGMCQRVAIAQALIMRPQLLLLDEPFGALDEATREEHQQLLLDLYQDNLKAKRDGNKPPTTMILVTHELNEALYVSDRIVALSPHWHWQDANVSAYPGATVIYDASGPPFPRDLTTRSERFFHQRAEIRQAAFEPTVRTRRGDYLRFWSECNAGKGVGVMQR